VQLRSLPVRGPSNPSRHKPKLGQNFLISTTAPRAIVEAMGDLSEATVLEIGPGKGILTQLLAPRAKKVIAVELDAALAASLTASFTGSLTGVPVEVLCRDVLNLDLTQLAAEQGARLQVLGNLPYYISSPILMHLFAHSAVIDRAVLMVQREVAERIVAPPGSSEYGLLSAITQMYAGVEHLFTLPPEAFDPPPKVYSTVFRLTMRSRFEELGVEAEGFLPFLRQIFVQKRKTLTNNLRSAGYTGLEQAFRACGIDAQIRAEALSLEGMACLYHSLNNPPSTES
jgi:16S rRNA (adenine1518-N6/adenine1519-N6)-dimethyltransferase